MKQQGSSWDLDSEYEAGDEAALAADFQRLEALLTDIEGHHPALEIAEQPTPAAIAAAQASFTLAEQAEAER